MPSKRFYVDEELEENALVVIQDAELHHLVHVMRTREGEEVELVNGRGILVLAQVLRLTRSQAELKVSQVVIRAPKPVWNLTLCQAFPKANRLSTILEKGTELGMTHCILFPGDQSEVTTVSQERVVSTCIAAMKQCGRLIAPEVSIAPPLTKWKIWPEGAFFGDVDPNAPALKHRLPSSPQDITFFIGPEKGFSEKEETCLRTHGVQGVKLHENILRTDTAPLLVLSVVSHHLMMPL